MTPTELRDRIGDRIVVASISGGKDSAAMSLHLAELGIEHRRVFCDTGWEAAETYDYLRGELTRVIGPIEEIRAPLQMEDLVRSKAMFPSRLRRFCTQELKVFPLRDFIAPIVRAGSEVVNTVGIRAEESAARAKFGEWEPWVLAEGIECDVWRPLLRWLFDDVVAIHKRHNLRPNPLYLAGATRVGCWPCIYARKAEVKLWAQRDPERVRRLRVLEAEITDAARARAEAKGEEIDWHRGWFAPRTGRVGRPWPIDQVVEWAQTSHGGKQFELFAADPGDEGCMRWGLCETDA